MSDPGRERDPRERREPREDRGGRGGRPSRDGDGRGRPGTGRIGHGGRARRTDPRQRSAQRPSERRRNADPARAVAYETLRAVSEGAYANLDLPQRLRAARLDSRDAAFATELVYGVTRLRGLYDAIVDRCAGRPLARIDPPVLDVLRLGMHQLFGMRVPTHAAVDATVGLARDVVGAGASSFTNAVLRRAAETSFTDWLGIVAPGAGARADGVAGFVAPTDLEDVAIAHSHPAWIVRALRSALLAHSASTPETVDADLLDLLHAHNTPADVTLVARPGLASLEELLDAGATAAEHSPLAAVLTGGGDPGRIPAVRQGRAAVQDEGSQLVVLALVAAYDARTGGSPGGASGDAVEADDADDADDAAGSRWLDLCAGPGGKAGLLAPLARERGATLFANEVSDHRADLVEAAVAAAMDAGSDVLVGVGDGRTVGAEEPNSFDLVLVDAPCTGLGALRRRPDARWRRTPADIGELTVLQEQLLASALDACRPGGVVAYVTCSPHDAETRQVVSRVTSSRDDVEILDARPHVSAAARHEEWDALGPGPFVQLWPHRHRTDGMFLALLSRR